MVQGLINRFGTVVMAAFAAAVKIDSFAYMPVQDFGNAFSTFVAQNYGANQQERIRKGIKSAVFSAFAFCVLVSTLVCVFARPLMELFIHPSETEIIRVGVEYLRIEASFYFGIGLLFLLYGFYRAMNRPGMSVILTVISLGTRVALAYCCLLYTSKQASREKIFFSAHSLKETDVPTNNMSNPSLQGIRKNADIPAARGTLGGVGDTSWGCQGER